MKTVCQERGVKGRKKTVATCNNLTLSQIRCQCVNYVTFVIVCHFIPVNFRLRFIFLFFCLSVDETKTAEQSPVKPKGRYICVEKIAFVMCSFYLPYLRCQNSLFQLLTVQLA